MENNKTIMNLKDAFKGETTASAKYAAYSKKAKEDGYKNIAVLFEAASYSEKIHANNHKKALEELGDKPDDFNPEFEIKSTKENLQDAINGETYEVTTMYPPFIETAKANKARNAIVTFSFAYKTEMRHKVLYETTLASLNAGKEAELPSVYRVCPICGNTYETEVPGKCGICGEPAEVFILFK
jgi:rubrerythrin